MVSTMRSAQKRPVLFFPMGVTLGLWLQFSFAVTASGETLREMPLTVATYSMPTLSPNMDKTAVSAVLATLDATLTGGGVDVACLQDTYVNIDTVLAGLPQYKHGYQLPAKTGDCKCKAEEISALVSAVFPCMSGTCAGLPTDTMMNCLMGPKCVGQVFNTTSQRCIGCIGAALVGGGNPMDIINRCAEKPDSPKTGDCAGPYDGQYGIAIVSKYPLTSTKASPFPNSVVSLRGFAHVAVDVSCGHKVELVCGWWRGNATILGRFGMPYFAPQSAKAYYGQEMTSPVQEAFQQADKTASLLSAGASADHPVIVAGNFASGPAVPASNIVASQPILYDRHSAGLLKLGFSNPFLKPSTAKGGKTLCSDCMSQMKIDLSMASAWMGRNVTEEELKNMMGDILIDHVFFRAPKNLTGLGSVSGVLAHRLDLPSGVEGIRYPVAISLKLSVPSVCPSTSSTSASTSATVTSKGMHVAIALLLAVMECYVFPPRLQQ